MSCHEDEINADRSHWLGYLLNDCITDVLLSSILSFVCFKDAHQIVSSLRLLENHSGCKEKRSWRSLHVWKEFFLRDGFSLCDGDDTVEAPKDDFWQLYVYRQRLFQRLCHRNPVQSFVATTRSTTKATYLSVPIPNFIPVECVLEGPSVLCSDVPPPSFLPCQFQLISLATGSSVVLLHQKPCTKIEGDASKNHVMVTTSVILLPKLLLNISVESYGNDFPLETFSRSHILLQWDHPVVSNPVFPSARLLPCKQLESATGRVSILIGCAVEVNELTLKEDVSPLTYTKIYIWRARFGDPSIYHDSNNENWRHLSQDMSIQTYACCRVSGSCHAMDYHCQSNGDSNLYLTKISPQSLSTVLEVHSVPRWDDRIVDGDARWLCNRRLGVFDVATPTSSHCSLQVDFTGRTVVIATPDHVQIWNMQAILERTNEAKPRASSRQFISDAILHIPILKRIRDLVEGNHAHATSGLHSILLGNIDNPRIPPRPQQERAIVGVGIHLPRHLSIYENGFITLHTNSDVNDNHHLDISQTAAIAIPYLVVWEFQPCCGHLDTHSAPMNTYESAWIISSVINLPLLSLSSSKPTVQYDGRRIIVFGQDFLGYIVLIYQFAKADCAVDGKPSISRSLPSRLPSIPRNGMEESGGVYNFSYPSTLNGSTTRAEYQRPRRIVKFVKRIRHDALHGGVTWDVDGVNLPLQLQMSCNERFLVFRTKRGDRLRPQYLDEWPPSFSDGLLYFDFDEGEYP
jgi:hypothetical protein